ncbi:hypothetical protein LXM25_25705 [Dyadobacter sp. LJ53]|uniref:hypothetical protein n=1 Tax=Dyadobacter chenwenxiniae TaxID=2906456 RepID=UPI001F349D3A|nr:hypothetical protein [Dyadobacter chenwenxiniae]MCF0053493.1 hypothetical protein [Dyadobacter chenwenxiniae]
MELFYQKIGSIQSSRLPKKQPSKANEVLYEEPVFQQKGSGGAEGIRRIIKKMSSIEKLVALPEFSDNISNWTKIY